MAVAFDPEHADDFITCFDDPEGVAPGFREDVAQPAYLLVDRRLNVLLEGLAHFERGELPIDADEERDNLSVVSVLISANDGGLLGCHCSHGSKPKTCAKRASRKRDKARY